MPWSMIQFQRIFYKNFPSKCIIFFYTNEAKFSPIRWPKKRLIIEASSFRVWHNLIPQILKPYYLFQRGPLESKKNPAFRERLLIGPRQFNEPLPSYSARVLLLVCHQDSSFGQSISTVNGALGGRLTFLLPAIRLW